MFGKSRLITIGMTLLVFAIAMRTDQGKALLNGDEKFLGIF